MVDPGVMKLKRRGRKELRNAGELSTMIFHLSASVPLIPLNDRTNYIQHLHLWYPKSQRTKVPR